MNKTIRIQYGILALIISFISLAVPFLFIADKQDAFTMGLALVGAVGAVIGVLYAYLIYKNLGIERIVIDKQINTVISFLDQVRALSLLIRVFENGKLYSFSTVNFSADGIKFFSQYSINKSEYKRTVAFDVHNLHTAFRELHKYRMSAWMPPEVSKKIEFATLPPLLVIDKAKPEYNSLIVAFFPDFPSQDGNYWGVFEKDCNDDSNARELLTFKEFYAKMMELIQICKVWLEDNANLPIPLNI